AEVDFTFKDPSTFARMDGSPVISLSVSKRAGENIIETAEAVKAAIEELRPEFPPSTRVAITQDQSEDIRDMVSNLENNIISGLLLVIGVLLFFLGVRNAVFVGIAIPLSMLLSFIVLSVAGITMNMIVLFSLILALGMLVDNAIVVVENIYRFMEEGSDRVTAAKKATGEVAIPVVAATATTVAAFMPIAFWPGIVGEFMGYLPLTLIITLSSSLFVGLVINPTLCSLFMRVEDAPPRPMTLGSRVLIGVSIGLVLAGIGAVNPLTSLLLVSSAAVLWAGYRFFLEPTGRWFLERVLPWMLGKYEATLRWALAHRGATLGLAAASFVVSFGLFIPWNSGVEFFPEDIPPSALYVQVEAPTGTSVDFTDRIVRDIEDEVGTLPGHPDYESVVSTVGFQQGTFGGGSSEHLATVAVSLVDFEQRRQDAFTTLEDLRTRVGQSIAGAEISVDEPRMGPPTGPPINIEIAGRDAGLLARFGEDLVDLLEDSPVGPRLDGLENDLAESRPELVVEVDRERAALFGLSTDAVGYEVRSAINGVEASTYRDGEEEYDVIVRLAERYREDLDAIADLEILREGRPVPLSSVASWHIGEGYGGINRKDQERVVTVSSDVRSGYQANAVLAQVRELVGPWAQENLPGGYTLSYTGQNQEQQEASEFLSRAFLIALFLIGFILISQFDSLTKPLLILFNVVLSTVGVLIGLIVFRMPFGIIMTGVGIISLAGIVVNNGIVLIDYIDILRDRDGMGRKEALVLGGMTRFRPVILTAITTILGLLPLAIGLNLDFLGLYTALEPEIYWGGEQAAWWGPMAIAVIAGLTFATFLTLILTPVMYSLIDDFNDWTKRVLVGEEA
ncbi:MAG: efflux RND transporter permease subunit, partial [bacterium]